MEKNEHSIQRLKLDLTLRGSENSQGMEAHLNEILRDRIFQLLEQELDRIDVSGQRLRIDQLELNLGAMPSSSVDEEFPVRFVDRLKEKLLGFEATESKVDVRIEESHTHLDAIRHYFKEGVFPWWFNAHKTSSLDDLVQQVLNNNHAAMAQVIKSELHNRNFLKRLTGQLQIVTLQKLLRSITPNLSQQVFVQVDELFQVLSQAYETKLDRSHESLGYLALFEQLVLGSSQIKSAADAVYHSLSKLAQTAGVKREIVVATLLREQKLNRHSTTFLQTLDEMKHYVLTDDRHDTLAGVMNRKKQAPNFKEQFAHAQSQSTSEAYDEGRTAVTSDHDRTSRILQHYLQNGSLPIWAADYTPAKLGEELLRQIVGHAPKLTDLLIVQSATHAERKTRWLRVLRAIMPTAIQKTSWQLLNDLKHLREFLEQDEPTEAEIKKHFKYIEQIGQSLLFYDGVAQAEELEQRVEVVEKVRESKDEENAHDELSSLLSNAKIEVTEGQLSSKQKITEQLREEVILLEELRVVQAQGKSIASFTPEFLSDIIAFYLTHHKWPWWMEFTDEVSDTNDALQTLIRSDTQKAITFEAISDSPIRDKHGDADSRHDLWNVPSHNQVLVQMITTLGKKNQKLAKNTLAKLVEHEIVLRRIVFQLPENILKSLLEVALPSINQAFWKAIYKMVQRAEAEVAGTLTKHNITATISSFLLQNLTNLQSLKAEQFEGVGARLLTALASETIVEQRNFEVEQNSITAHIKSGSDSEKPNKEGQSDTANQTDLQAVTRVIATLEKTCAQISDDTWASLSVAEQKQTASELFRRLSDQQILGYLLERGSLPAEGAVVTSTEFLKLLQRAVFKLGSSKVSTKPHPAFSEKTRIDTPTAADYLSTPKAQAFIFNVLSGQVLDEMLTEVLEKHKKGLYKTVSSFRSLLCTVMADYSNVEVLKASRKALFGLLSASTKQLTPGELLSEMIARSAMHLNVNTAEWNLRWMFALNSLKKAPNHDITKSTELKLLFRKSFIAKFKTSPHAVPKSIEHWVEFIKDAGIKPWAVKLAQEIGDAELIRAFETKHHLDQAEFDSSSHRENQQATSDKKTADDSADKLEDIEAGSIEQSNDSNVIVEQEARADLRPGLTEDTEQSDAVKDLIHESSNKERGESAKEIDEKQQLSQDEETLGALRNDAQVCMDTLYFFLVFGNLPWWSVYANVKELEKYVRELAKSQPELFRAHLERLLNDRLVGDRLRDFFEDLLDVQATETVAEESLRTDVEQQEQVHKHAAQEVKVLDWLLKAEGIEKATLEALHEYLPIYLRHLNAQGVLLADQPELILQLSAQLLSIRLGKSYADVLALVQEQAGKWQSNELSDAPDDKQALRLSMEQVVARLQKQLDKLEPGAAAVESYTARYRAVDHSLFEGDNEVFMRFIGQHLLSKFEPEEFSIFFNLLNFTKGEEEPTEQLSSLFTNALYYLSIREGDAVKGVVRNLYSAADAESEIVVRQLTEFNALLQSLESTSDSTEIAEDVLGDRKVGKKEATKHKDDGTHQVARKGENVETDIPQLQTHLEARLLSEFTAAFLKLAPKLNFANYQEQLHTVFYLAMARPISRTGVHQAIRDFLKIVAQKEQKDIKSILIYLLDQVDRAEGKLYKYLPQLLRHSLGELALGQKLIPQFAKAELEPVLTTFNYALHHEQSERIEWLYESAANYLALKSNKAANELAHDILANVDPGQAMRHASYYRILERVANKTRTDLSKAEQRLLNTGDVDLQEILRRKEQTYRIMDLIAELTLMFERVVPELNLKPYLQGTNKDWYVLLAQRGNTLDINALLWHWFQQLAHAERYAITELIKYLLEQAKVSAFAFANLTKLLTQWLSALPVSSPKGRTRALPVKVEQKVVLEASVESQLNREDKQELLKKFTDALETSDYLLEEILDNTLATFQNEEGLRKEYEEMLLEKHDWGDNEQSDDKLYISNAGIVLVWPFLPRFFNNLGYLEKGQFKGREFQERAVHVLQYLVDTRENVPEYTLMLNKLMCGMEVKEAIKREVVLTKEEKHECEVLLKTVIVQWDTVKNTPVDAFRQSFFQREGALFLKNGKWNLNVEHKAYDVILKTLPWGLSLVRFSWSENVIYLEWKA